MKKSLIWGWVIILTLFASFHTSGQIIQNGSGKKHKSVRHFAIEEERGRKYAITNRSILPKKS